LAPESRYPFNQEKRYYRRQRQPYADTDQGADSIASEETLLVAADGQQDQRRQQNAQNQEVFGIGPAGRARELGNSRYSLNHLTQ